LGRTVRICHSHGRRRDGLEIPEAAGPIGFAAGFLSGTSLLHLAGVGIGMLSDRWIAVSVPVRIADVLAVALGGGLLVR
jgi:urease accessory protein